MGQVRYDISIKGQIATVTFIVSLFLRLKKKGPLWDHFCAFCPSLVQVLIKSDRLRRLH